MTSADYLKKIQAMDNLPIHIAIIMDGNGRWAKEHSRPRIAGHREGINSVREITRICGEIGIRHLTLYTFSKENWKRPKTEVSALMRLLLTTIRSEVKELNKNNVRLTTIGKLEDIPTDARKGILEGIELTQKNTGLNLNLALSYGSRQELVKCMQEIARDVKTGALAPNEISEQLISKNLYTRDLPDPDLLIRTGKEYRFSNFLLWQIAYTELLVSDVYWPDFREQQLLEAIYEYQTRERRFGQLSEQTK